MDSAARNNADPGADGATADESLTGFGLGTPTDGPAQAPSYSNFSPLFSSANLSSLPPVAPIALRANAPQPPPSVDSSFFPSFLDSNGHSGNGFLMDPNAAGAVDAVYSYGPPVPIPCKALPGMKRRRLDDYEAATSGTSTTAPRANGDRPVDNLGYGGHTPLASYYNGGFPLPADSQHDPASYYAAPFHHVPQQQQRSHAPPPPSSSSPPEMPLTPESAIDAVLKKSSGSSCHQCKNRRESRHLNFCRNRTRSANDDKKKKICRKKFCDHCIIKFNYQARLPPKNSRDWECPSCLGICVCAACRRKHDPQLVGTTSACAIGEPMGAPSSPTLSFAHKLFYNPELIAQVPDAQRPVVDTMPFFNSAF